MTNPLSIPSVSVTYAQNGTSTKANALGMRPMQERAYQKRGEQYLLIKSPPASGKSRALMFIALDKLENQGLKQAIIVVPEKSIGASFHNQPLSQYGFWADWVIEPRRNLCDAPGGDNGGKVDAVKKFLDSDAKVLVCTHATFRFAVDRFGVEMLDDRLIAVDEFHHVSANPDNKLGDHICQLMARDKTHIVAMTGSYFRGDAEAVLHPDDEARFETVTYTYYEQLNGYQYLKQLDIGYYFYAGRYSDEIMQVLNPNEKTILHIPNVNSRESTKDKIREVEHIIEEMGEWQGTDPQTGFQLVKTADGKVLKIADLVDDDPSKRDRVVAALKDPAQKHNRDHVDIIIALGMAKEGFDWIWCEHALTVGYRSSLTEIIQIIGRATRDAPGKTRARFTNLIAEPDASEEAITEAVNDTLKAIAASLLMEQVLAPRFEFKPKRPDNQPTPGFDYGEGGYDANQCNVGVNPETGQIQIEIKGLAEPKSPEATRICREDLTELVTAFVQDKPTLERGLFDEELVPEELTQVRMGKIVKEKFPNLDTEDQEAVRQHAIAALNLVQQAKQRANKASGTYNLLPSPTLAEESGVRADPSEPPKNTALIDGVRQFALSVTELDMDLLDIIKRDCGKISGMTQRLTVVDLFSGCGGLSLGFEKASFDIIASYDSWKPAIETYGRNFHHIAHLSELNEQSELPRSLVIAGGPPCQGFSSAGRRQADDERNTLVRVFAKLIASHKPMAFVFENVEGFLTQAQGRFVFDLLEPLIDAGYRIHLRKVNAAHFGVPQHRKRVLAIGGLGWDPTFPEHTHSALGAPGARLANGHHLPFTPTLEEALAGLPPAKVTGSGEKDTFDHTYAPFNKADRQRAHLLKPGQRMRDLPEELWHESYRKRAYRRVMDGTPSERRGGAPAGLRRLSNDEPSKAITGGAIRDFVHPTEDRPLTIRECARLQTFPDDFLFVGTQSEKIQMIGNAVPVRLAQRIAETLKEDLRLAKSTQRQGALLSFVPTLSEGMSPILQAVCDEVRERFLSVERAEQISLCL